MDMRGIWFEYKTKILVGISSIVGILILGVLVFTAVNGKSSTPQVADSDTELPQIIVDYIEENRELNTMFVAGSALYEQATKQVKDGGSITAYLVEHVLVNDPGLRVPYTIDKGVVEDALSYTYEEGERYVPRVFMVIQTKEGEQFLEVY